MSALPEWDLPMDRWTVNLDEPTPPPVAAASEPEESHVLLFSLDIPTLEFRPRLSRFDEAA